MRCGRIACGCYANRRKRGGFADVAPNGAGELGGLCVATRMSPLTGLYRFCPDWGILRGLWETLPPKARSGKRVGFADVAPNGAGELGGLCVATRMSPLTGLFRCCPDWGKLRGLWETYQQKNRSGKRKTAKAKLAAVRCPAENAEGSRMSPLTGLHRCCPYWGILRVLRET
jgi:hypothetical protein